ncbi:hypothetical protein TNCV_4562071 [Trichonephila clavipes]|nr:hypothetical protein TNCV_4562071 [Trichonephila clavipes]
MNPLVGNTHLFTLKRTTDIAAHTNEWRFINVAQRTTSGLLTTNFVILSPIQAPMTTSKRASCSPNFHTRPCDDLSLDKFDIHQPPLYGWSSVLQGLQPVTQQGRPSVRDQNRTATAVKKRIGCTLKKYYRHV